MNRRAVFRVAVVAALVVAVAGTGAADTVLFDDFEDGDTQGWTQRTDGSSTIQATSSPVADGSYSGMISKSDGTAIFKYNASSAKKPGSYTFYLRNSQVTDGWASWVIRDSNLNRVLEIDLARDCQDNRNIQEMAVGYGSPDCVSYSSPKSDTWYVVELTDIDYSASEFDIRVLEGGEGGSTVVDTTMEFYETSASNMKQMRFGSNSGGNDDVYYDEVDVSGLNNPPVFNASSINPDPPLIGQYANYSAEVYDPDGSIQYTNLSLTGSAGCSLSDEKRTGTNPSWDGLCTPSGEGWLNATFETVDDAGEVSSTELIRSVENNPPNISIDRPNDEEKASDVPINYTVSDDFLVTGCSYNIDGGMNTSLPDCTNTSTSFSQVGNYTLNLYANDSGGNTGQRSKQFIANLYNWFTAEDDVTGSTIDDFSVTFSNGTTSGGSGSTTTGQFRTGTFELPTGNVTAKFKADGYSRTTKYYQVDDSFQLNDTIQMERTSLNFEVFDEQNTGSGLHYNTTVSNSTRTIDMTSIVKRSETNGGYETYLDKDWVVADEVDFLANELDNDGFNEENCYRITLTYLNQSTKEISECQGRNDVSDTVSISDLLYRNIEFELYNNGQDGDSFDVDVAVEDTDKDGFTAEYLDLTDAGFPTGDIRWSVNNKIYNGRTYFTDLDPFTTFSLTAYLLQEGQGNYMNVETVDPSFNTVSNAEITIQQRIDGTYQTVGQGRTGTTGTASFYLNPDIQHRIVVTHPNYASFTGTFEPSNYQFDPLQIQLGSTSAGGYTTVWDTVEAQVLPATATLTPEQQTWNASIIDSENSLSLFSFTVNGPNQTLNSSTVTNQPSGGFINLTANLSQFDPGTDITATLQFSKDQQVFNYTRTYTVRSEVEAGPFSIIETMQTFENEASDFATSMTAVIILLAVGTFTGSAIGGTGAGIIMLVFLGFFVVTNWMDMFTFIITAFTLLGLYAMNRG